MGCEQTFLEDIYAKSAVIIELYHTVLELLERIAKSGFEGRTLTLKVKFSDFTQITRSISQEKILTKRTISFPLPSDCFNWQITLRAVPSVCWAYP